MYAVRMTQDGKLLTEGSVVMKGALLDYPSKSTPSKIVTTELVLLDTEFHSQRITFTEMGSIYTGTVSSASQQITYHLDIELGSDGSWCIIRQNDLYIVCSIHADFDPDVILSASTFFKAD